MSRILGVMMLKYCPGSHPRPPSCEAGECGDLFGIIWDIDSRYTLA